MEHLTVVFLIFLMALAKGANITIKGRIIGGEPVDIESHPYIVSLLYHNHHICGASIIAPDTILTAAHCTHYDGDPSQYTIRSGSSSVDLDGTIHQVYEIQVHPNYNSESKTNDVAKLKITPPIIYSASSQPIRLCSERPADNTLLVVSGWGRQKEGVKPSVAEGRNLRAVYVRAINQNRCARQYRNMEINSAMICAGAPGKDSCQGDSGGPLVDPSTGEQCGVASWGIGCASRIYPGVYASVPDLLDFIES